MSEEMSSGPTRLVAAGVTDVGKTREINEDNILVEPDLDLFVVADGMGGHSAGDVASSMATKSIAGFFNALKHGPPASDGNAVSSQGLSPEAQSLVTAIRKANQELYSLSSTDARHKGMGSTIVALLFSREQNQVHVAHVGDSRCYRIRDGKIEQLTRDHSLVNEALALKPDLTKAQIARLPKNVITRALGMAPVVQVDIRTERLQPGDSYLLCSDGLSGLVPDEQMLEVVGMAEDTNEACELLIAFANDAGGTDNISALVVRIEGEEGHEAEAGAPSSAAIEIELAASSRQIEEPPSEELPAASAEISEDTTPADAIAARDEEPSIVGHARVGEAEFERPVTNAASLRSTAAMEAEAEEAAADILAVSDESPEVAAAEDGAPEIDTESEDIPPELLDEAEEVAAIDVEAPESAEIAPPEETGPPVFISPIIDINAPPGTIPAPLPPEPRQKSRRERAAAVARAAAASAESESAVATAVEVSEGSEVLSEFADTLVGDEIDSLLDFGDSSPTSFVPVARCSNCDHELYIGNLFCTECGARVEEE
jgi:protein phosphatase